MDEDLAAPDQLGSWPARFDDEDFAGPSHEIGGRAGHHDYLRRTFHNADFLVRYPITVLRAKHRETLLGLGWEVVNPALLVLVWWIIREVVFPTAGGRDYLEFLVVSVFTFQYLQRFVVGGQASIHSTKGLLQSFNFPPLVAVVQQSVTIFVSNLFSIVVLFAFLVAAGERPALSWIAFVPILALQSVFAFGGSMVLARLTAQSPDVRNMVPFMFRLLFYASGVIFPIEDRIAGSSIRYLFELNPFYSITALTRSVLIGGGVDGITFVSALAWGLLLPIVGYAIFRTGDERYAS